jgi:hypothetical protein
MKETHCIGDKNHVVNRRMEQKVLLKKGKKYSYDNWGSSPDITERKMPSVSSNQMYEYKVIQINTKLRNTRFYF